MRVNLGCGNSFFDQAGWINLDYESQSVSVVEADLANTIPLPDAVADFIYSSHLIEHLRPDQVRSFLLECFRILKPGGTLRIVTPDLENIARQYLANIENKKYALAELELLLLIDQFVRVRPGGLYRQILNELRASAKIEEIDYVYVRTGEHPIAGKDAFKSLKLAKTGRNQRRKFISRKFFKLRRLLNRLRFQVAAYMMPGIYRSSNVTFTSPGERHSWIYDYYTLSNLLLSLGFKNSEKLSYRTTNYYDNAVLQLDVDRNEMPRKGAQSMYIEVTR
jgi:SAM-dependent methyltransferase